MMLRTEELFCVKDLKLHQYNGKVAGFGAQNAYRSLIVEIEGTI